MAVVDTPMGLLQRHVGLKSTDQPIIDLRLYLLHVTISAFCNCSFSSFFPLVLKYKVSLLPPKIYTYSLLLLKAALV